MQPSSALTILSEDEKLLRQAVLDFSRQEIAPRVRQMDAAGAIDPAVWQGVFELGLMGIETPEAHGGAGASFFDAILVVEALAEFDPSVSVLVDVQNTLVANTLLRVASPAQQERYLPRLAADTVGAYALSEAASGSDAFALKSTAKKTATGWRLNGSKLWITNGGEADLFIIFANADPEAGYRGISAFLVERGTPGFQIEKKEDKLGIRASSTCPLSLENVDISEDALLGEVGTGYKVAIETLNEGRIGIGAQMVGLAAGALRIATEHVCEREQFGQKLSEFQAIQYELAEMRTDWEAARLMVYNAARLKDAGEDFVAAAAMAKLFSSQVAERNASRAVELLGGVGFTKEYGAEKLYRDAKIGAIYEGTSNMQRTTIAKLHLKQYL
ncbi:MAG: acyl-CoA dehydrogenase family protein [Polyangiaceae bacterium]|nr:acyl-CoA dehydrogenase family protein [Polyangiaceae bacterium]